MNNVKYDGTLGIWYLAFDKTSERTWCGITQWNNYRVELVALWDKCLIWIIYDINTM